MFSTDNIYSLDSDDDFRSGCRNVSHHYPDNQTTLLHVTPGFKPFTVIVLQFAAIGFCRLSTNTDT